MMDSKKEGDIIYMPERPPWSFNEGWTMMTGDREDHRRSYCNSPHKI